MPCRFCLVGGLVGVARRGLVGGLVDEGSLKILLWLVGAFLVLSGPCFCLVGALSVFWTGVGAFGLVLGVHGLVGALSAALSLTSLS